MKKITVNYDHGNSGITSNSENTYIKVLGKKTKAE